MLSATTTAFVSKVPIAFPSLPPPNPSVSTCGINNDGQIGLQRVTASKTKSLRLRLVTNSVSGDSSAPVDVDVPFPSDYFELLQQVPIAFPSLPPPNPSVSTCGINNDGQIGLQRVTASKTKSLRLRLVTNSVSGDSSAPVDVDVPFPSDYFELLQQLCVFCLNSLIGTSKASSSRRPVKFNLQDNQPLKEPPLNRVKPEDELFLVAYPYFNVNEMLVVEELYKEAVENTARKLIIFNGELDRIRSGYYPSFFYPKLAKLSKTLLPLMETVYYIHNFKGRNGGILFRCYPGPWKVLRKVGSKYICLHQQEVMPSLKEVALDILISA
nr:hypothetical protein CFP56_58438 [Quercus suber]